MINNLTELTPDNVVQVSSTYKGLVLLEQAGVWKTKAIRYAARRFLRNNTISYNKEKKVYQCCLNNDTFDMAAKPDKSFNCSCEFYKNVIAFNQTPGLVCPHVCALKMMLKIWNHNRRRDKLMFPPEEEI